jgi:hypothetical protein
MRCSRTCHEVRRRRARAKVVFSSKPGCTGPARAGRRGARAANACAALLLMQHTA